MNIIIYTDGASRGNPGPAAWGFLVSDASGQTLYQEGQTIGIATNNLAEYTAVLKALTYVKDHLPGSHQIEVVTDSLLIAQQLSGQYKVKSSSLRTLFDAIKSLEYELGIVSYRHVPRSANQRADRLANQALDLQK